MKYYLLFASLFIISIGFSQDLLILRNGKILKVKVLEVTADEVKFKKEEIKDGPTYSERKSDVCYIQYPNFRDVLTDCSTTPTNTIDATAVVPATTTPPKQQSINTTPPPAQQTANNTYTPYTYFKLINDFVLKTKIKQVNDYNYHIDVYDEKDKFMYETILLTSNIKERQAEDGRLRQLYDALYDEYKDEIVSVTKPDGLILNFILFSQDDDLVWFTYLGETKKQYMLKKNIASTTSKVITFNKGLYTPPTFTPNTKINLLTKSGNPYNVLYIRENADTIFVKDSRTVNIVPVAKNSIAEINGKPYDYVQVKGNTVVTPQATVSTPAPTQPKVEDPATSGTIIFIDFQRVDVDAIDIRVDDDLVMYKKRGSSITTAIDRNEVLKIKYKNGKSEIITKQD